MTINPQFFFWTLAAITFMIIATQTINTWYIFEHFSKIENLYLKRFQSIMFCSIISLFILTTVFIGEGELALGGAILEAILNFYYYAQEFWEGGYKNFSGKPAVVKKKRRQSILKFWRKYWLKMLLSAVIPAFIYGCSWLMMKVNTGG